MAIERWDAAVCVGWLLAACLSGCGTVKEKTAPCKRPAVLSGYAADPRQACGAMRLVLAPDVRFSGLVGD